MNLKLLFICLLFTTYCVAQDNSKQYVSNVTKLTLLNPGISFEKIIGKYQTIVAQAFIRPSFGFGFSVAVNNTSFVYFDPAVAIQYRYYYNYTKREARGKRTDMNSMNYLSPLYNAVFSNENTSSSSNPVMKMNIYHTVGFAWGLQRNYINRFSIDFNLGGGYNVNKVYSTNSSGQVSAKTKGRFTTLVQLNIGFWLNRKK